MERPEMGMYKVRRRLPTAYYTEIGRIISRFAVIEMGLFQITSLILGIGKKQARLSLKKFRVRDQFRVIEDLSRLNGIRLPKHWRQLRDAFVEVESYRDRLAHGVWLHHPTTKTPVIQDFSTAYVDDAPKGVKPKIDPLAVTVPIEHLKNIRANIDQIHDEIQRVENLVIQQLIASQNIQTAQQPQTQSATRPRKNPKSRKLQPESSRE